MFLLEVHTAGLQVFRPVASNKTTLEKCALARVFLTIYITTICCVLQQRSKIMWLDSETLHNITPSGKIIIHNHIWFSAHVENMENFSVSTSSVFNISYTVFKISCNIFPK